MFRIPLRASVARSVAVALAVVVSVLAAVRPASADVLLNEFERTGTGTDRIELVNTRADTSYSLTGWYVANQLGSSFALSGILGPGGHAAFLTAGAIVTDGGLIELYDGILPNPRDSVPFGDEGGAPLPPPVGTYSCGRAPDGTRTGDPAADWNLDATSTFAASNDQLPAGLGMTSVFLNEAGNTLVRSGGTSCDAPAVELYNYGPAPIDVMNWRLVDGRSVTLLSGIIPSGGFLVVTDFPPEFCFELSGVLYLFDVPGRRVDQVGVHGVPLPPVLGESYQRIPDGAVPFGPYDGFNFPTSGGGLSWQVRPHTLGSTNVTEPLPAGGEVGTSSWGRTKIRYR